jgi:hypothetical protein
MNVGLPGAGIGGLYYLICTAVMPFKEIFLTLTKPKHQFRYRLVFTQFSISSAIIIGFIAIYQLVSILFESNLLLKISISNDSFLPSLLLPIVISLALLVFILTLVELSAFISKKRIKTVIKK